jgi:hypothetical protein
MSIENVTFLNSSSHAGKVEDPNSIKLRAASYNNMQMYINREVETPKETAVAVNKVAQEISFEEINNSELSPKLRKMIGLKMAYGTASHRIKVPGAKIENMTSKVNNGIETPAVTIDNNQVDFKANDINTTENSVSIPESFNLNDSFKTPDFSANTEVKEEIVEQQVQPTQSVVTPDATIDINDNKVEETSDYNKPVDFQPISNKVEEKDEGEDIAKKIQEIQDKINEKLANSETKVEASYFTPTDVENNDKVEEKEDFELPKIEDEKPIEEKTEIKDVTSDVSVVNASISDLENLKGIALPKEFIEKIQNSKAQADKMKAEAEKAQEAATKAQEEVEKAKAELAEKQKMVTEALENKYSQEAEEAKNIISKATDENNDKKEEEKSIKAQIEQLEAFKREALNNKNSQDVSKMFDNSSAKEETSSIHKVA